MQRKLGMRQAAFVVLLLEGVKPPVAYRQAGFIASTDRIAQNNANRLMSSEVVSSALRDARAAAAQRAVVTVETIAAELDAIVAVALAADPPQTSSAVAARLGKAKLYGLLVDRKAVEVTQHKPALSNKQLELSEDEWKRQFGPGS